MESIRRLLPVLLAAALLAAGCDDDHHEPAAPTAPSGNETVGPAAPAEDEEPSVRPERDESRGPSSTDTGDNDPNLVVCIGDSLTAGIHCEGASYPDRLAAMCGKKVVNLGVGGVTSAYGRSHVSEALERHPGYVCILYGSNDPGHGIGASETGANIRAIIDACKAASCVPIVGTPPPTVSPHRDNNEELAAIAAEIRSAAKAKGAGLVDIHAAFSADPEKYLNPDDGLHFSAAGGDLVAKKFDSRL